MPSPETRFRAPLRPLLAKEWREIIGGRALWTMLLLLCPLVGFSFFQALALYGEASTAARPSSVLAAALSPFDGIVVPTFGGFYVGVTLLFPFVAIRVLGSEKETGALRLLVQLPYRTQTLIIAKLAATGAAWLLSAVPALSSLAIWLAIGGHLGAAETGNLLAGHLLYGLLIGSIALFAAAISESSATAAIITLAFTIGSWVLDFTAAGQPGLLGSLSSLSLTQTLRSFEQGLLSAAVVIGAVVMIGGFTGLAAIWMPPGVPIRTKFMRSAAWAVLIALGLGAAFRTTASLDLTEDRRNSFSVADQRALTSLTKPLGIAVHLAPEDPRFVDLRREVLSKLERAVPHISIHLVGGRLTAGSDDDHYGEVAYTYDGRSEVSRSTSPSEILPILYGLAGIAMPTATAGPGYSGYPLVANGQPALVWFFGLLPASILLGWWRSRRPPRILPWHDGDRP